MPWTCEKKRMFCFTYIKCNILVIFPKRQWIVNAKQDGCVYCVIMIVKMCSFFYRSNNSLMWYITKRFDTL